MPTKINKQEIDRMTFEGKDKTAQDIRWCDSLPGFGVRVFESGKKTFVIRYRVAGRKRYYTIGTYGAITVQQARDIAKQKLASVISGSDPQAERQKQTKGKTVADLIEAYIERHAKPRKASWKHDAQRLRDYVLPHLGSRLINSVRKSDIVNIHELVGIKLGKKGAANHVVRTLSKAFSCAVNWGYVEEISVNPCRGIKLFPSQSRERFVTQEEMPRLAAAIDNEPNIYARSLIWLYLLTGCRKSELRTLKWSSVDLKRCELALETTKSGRAHYLPLNRYAIDILLAIPKQYKNAYVFCGRNESKPIINIDRSWRRIREEARLEDVRIHDLRRTVGSWLAISGSSLHLIGSILNHSNTSTTAIYSRFTKEPVKNALDRYAENIMTFSHRETQPLSDSDGSQSIH